MAAGPGPLVHIAVCCETTGGGTVQLHAYDTSTGQMRHALDVAQALGEDPANGRPSHGKVHFALCPRSDGWVYAATHASTPPLGESIWHAKTMWNDAYRSFSGGHLFRYNPETSQCEDLGIPMPNVGIPAMELDEPRNQLVGVTYPTGHLLFFDAPTGQAHDAGRISECYPLCLLLDGQGRAWTSDSYGYMIRVDLAGRSADILAARTPQPGEATGLTSCMCDGRLGPDGMVYGVSYATPNLFRFKPTADGEIEIEDLGLFAAKVGKARGLCFGDDGLLYACVFNAHEASRNIRLARFDPSTGKGEVLGQTYTQGASRRWWRMVKGADGKLYAGECGRKPVSMIIIDPSEL
jgi:streptogramin lyase